MLFDSVPSHLRMGTYLVSKTCFLECETVGEVQEFSSSKDT